MHHHPGSISIASGKGSRGKTLFPFPVTTDPALRKISENGMTTEMPVDILPVDLPGSKLEPGQTVNTSLYIRAPEQLGSLSLPLYFYYESPPLSDTSRIHHYRMTKLCYVIKVGASINVAASRSHPCLHDNNLCQTVLVAVNNATGTQIQQVSHTPTQLARGQLMIVPF